MTSISLSNTRTRRKEAFQPQDPDNVRMYVCGPTVYDRAHLGNARAAVVFDMLFRLLRQVYGADHVTYVRNFTDVDDKINAEAQRRKGLGDPRPLEELIRARTEETIGWYHADMDALGVLRPTAEPRATDYIAQMQEMIGALIASGHAYASAGHVLFRVRAYADYGKLSGRSVEDMIAGARVEVAPFKEDPMDFVLWKPSDDELPGWESPWGRGRPGWHIECSAMSRALLGEGFDIHGGGIDLMFPHHENEIAQSRCAHPEGGFANVWMHNEMLQVEGKKMSKSLGNFFTVRDLLDEGYPGEVIRFVMLQTHYGKPMDWTEAKARDARATLLKWHTICHSTKLSGKEQLDPDFLSMLADDLNTAGAIGVLHGYARLGNAVSLLAGAQMIGLLTPEMSEWFTFGAETIFDDPRVEKLVNERARLRAAGEYAIADNLRDRLAELGVWLRDSKDRTAFGHEYSFLAQTLGSKARKAHDAKDFELARATVGRMNEFGIDASYDPDEGPSALQYQWNSKDWRTQYELELAGLLTEFGLDQ